jgi:hypothetical protein
MHVEYRNMGRYNQWLIWGGFGGIVLLFLCAIALFWSQPVQAQGPGDMDLRIEKRLQGSEVVQVGQILTFKIVIENTGTVSITHIEAEDNFVESIVAPSGTGPFAKPDDPPLSEPAGTFDGVNTIVWDDLVESLPGGALAPGEQIEIFVHLRAVHPSEQLQTVNEARIREAIAYDLRKELDIRDDVPSDVRGSNAPVTKKVANVGDIVVGTPVTFTIEIRNGGLSPIRNLPLSDEFNPSVLEFVQAVPPADLADTTNGLLKWDDLLVTLGREQLGPGETIKVVTVYRARRATDLSVNKAKVDMAQDEYGNTLAPDDSNVPIRIIPANTATATTEAQATATATTEAQATATATTEAQATATATTEVQATATATTETQETATATAQAPRGGDDDDDDNDDDTEEAIATATAQATATATAQATATATAQATATQDMWVTSEAVMDTSTATAEIVIPRTLPRTSQPVSPPSHTAPVVAIGILSIVLAALGASGLRRPRP